MTGGRLGPTGIAPLSVGLAPDTLEHLREIARTHGFGLDALDALIDDLDQAAMIYRSAQSIQADSLPSKVRDELAAVQAAVLGLVDRLNALGGLSRQILYTENRAGDRDSLWASLDHIMECLKEARAVAAALSPSGGRPQRYADILMAARVAHAIRKRLGAEPTITRGGLFEELLKTMIEALEPGRDDPSVRDLMRDALRARVTEHPGGALEIDPSVE